MKATDQVCDSKNRPKGSSGLPQQGRAPSPIEELRYGSDSQDQVEWKGRSQNWKHTQSSFGHLPVCPRMTTVESEARGQPPKLSPESLTLSMARPCNHSSLHSSLGHHQEGICYLLLGLQFCGCQSNPTAINFKLGYMLPYL